MWIVTCKHCVQDTPVVAVRVQRATRRLRVTEPAPKPLDDHAFELARADGENQDTLHASANHVLSGGPIHPGTYDVEVRTEGYQVWRRENVKVSEAGWCSKVQTVELTAKMVRLAARG